MKLKLAQGLLLATALLTSCVGCAAVAEFISPPLDEETGKPTGEPSPADQLVSWLPHPYDKIAGGVLALSAAELTRRKLKKKRSESETEATA